MKIIGASPGAGQVFDQAGEMADEKIKAQLQQFLAGFIVSLQKGR